MIETNKASNILTSSLFYTIDTESSPLESSQSQIARELSNKILFVKLSVIHPPATLLLPKKFQEIPV